MTQFKPDKHTRKSFTISAHTIAYSAVTSYSLPVRFSSEGFFSDLLPIYSVAFSTVACQMDQ